MANERKLWEMSRQEREEELKRRRKERNRVLAKRRDHLIELLERVVTADIHDKRMHRRQLKNYSHVDEDSPLEEIKKLRRYCEGAEAFLFRVANKYPGH